MQIILHSCVSKRVIQVFTDILKHNSPIKLNSNPKAMFQSMVDSWSSMMEGHSCKNISGCFIIFQEQLFNPVISKLFFFFLLSSSNFVRTLFFCDCCLCKTFLTLPQFVFYLHYVMDSYTHLTSSKFLTFKDMGWVGEESGQGKQCLNGN